MHHKTLVNRNLMSDNLSALSLPGSDHPVIEEQLTVATEDRLMTAGMLEPGPVPHWDGRDEPPRTPVTASEE